MKLHYYGAPVGPGEFSRNRFRPLCQPDAVPVFIAPDQRHLFEPLSSDEMCSDCRDIALALAGVK